MSPLARHIPLLLLSIALIAALGCNDRDDDAAALSGDVGVDADQPLSLEAHLPPPPNFDEAEPGTLREIQISPARRRAVISAEPPLPIADFLTPSDLEDLFEDLESLEARALTGQTPSETYNFLRLSPESSQFGFALQTWRLPEGQRMEARLEELRSQFLNITAPEIDGIPSPYFGSSRAGLKTLVFGSQDGRHLHILSCDDQTCSQWRDFNAPAARIAARSLQD